jgi:alkylation response protein AidB-like acyl-CoA dehydrogenase
VTEERAALRDTLRRLLEDAGGTAIARERWGTTGVGPGDPAWKGLAALGACGVLAPEAAGGLGLDLADAAVVVAELGRVAAPLPFVSSAVGAVSALSLAGDPLGLLPALCEGSSIGTVAVLEPGQRGRWDAPTVTVKNGALSGVKSGVADAGAADIIVVSARDDQGIGLYAVRDARVEPVDSVDGTRPLATVHLDATPGTRLDEGDHTDLLRTVVDRVQTALVIDGVAAAQSAFDLAMDYTRTREQFGKPIGAFQAVQHLCVDAFQSLTMARVSAEAALAGEHVDVLTATAWATEHLPQVTGAAIAVFAGIGFTWEHDVGLFHKRCLSLASAWGSAGDHLAALADSVLS